MFVIFTVAVYKILILYVVCRCVVWTGDGRVFFYNPSSRTSVWERPEDLVGRSDVDKMLATPPDVLLPQTNKSAPSKSKPRDSDTSDSEEGTPAKKVKKEQPPG